MANTNDSNDTTNIMNEVVQHTRALDHSFTTWDETKDRKAAADALSRLRLLELRIRKLRDRLTEDVQAYDREHDPHDPRD